MSYKVVNGLNQYQFNIHSQIGEDGVIQEILKYLGLNNVHNRCVEFGAWDGIHFCNTSNNQK